MDVTPAPERRSPAETVRELYNFAIDQDVLRRGIWFPAERGPVMISMYGSDHLLVAQAHSSPPELASKFSYHFADRYEYTPVCSFDSNLDPHNLRLESINPPRLHDGESLTSAASNSLASIAADIKRYQQNKGPLDIAQLRERIATDNGSSSIGLTLSLKVNLPEKTSELLEVLALSLEQANSKTPGAVASFLPICGWCIQALTEKKLKSGEVDLSLLEKQMLKYEAAIRQYVSEIPEAGPNQDTMRLRAGFFLKKAELAQLLLQDYRDDSQLAEPQAATSGWQGTREQDAWRQARVDTVPVVQSFNLDAIPEILEKFEIIKGGSDSNNAGGHMRLFASLMARRNSVPTLVTWKHSNKPLGLVIDGHQVAGMQSGQIGIPDLGLQAATMTYDSLDPKKGVFERAKGMILWLPEGSVVTVDPRYARHFFDTELDRKSLFDL